jgi:hypothetical protein
VNLPSTLKLVVTPTLRRIPFLNPSAVLSTAAIVLIPFISFQIKGEKLMLVPQTADGL